jgi:hypothetical protein
MLEVHEVIDWEGPCEYEDLIEGLVQWCKYAMPEEPPEDYQFEEFP